MSFSLRILLLLLGCALLLFPALGVGPLERAEIYFLDGARAMVERGDYLVPRYQGQPFFDKPALAYWLMALSFQLFGFSAGAARLVSALAALGTLLATVWLGSLLFERRAAWLGGLVLSTTLGFVAFGRIAMSDMPLTLWTILSVTLAVRAFQRPPAPWAVPALGAALGLGFLTKGPVAVVLPGLGVLAYLWHRRRERWPLSRAGVGVAVLLFCLLGFGWFVLLGWRLGPGPLEHFFLRENLQRFAAETYDAGQPSWFYLAAYLAEGLPWSPFLPLVAWSIWRAPRERAGSGGWLLLWLLLVVLLLSLSRGKLDYYLLPCYPAVSLLIGRTLASTASLAGERAWTRAVLALLGPVPLLVPLLAARLPPGWGPTLIGEGVLWLLAAAAWLGCLAALRRPTGPRAATALALATGATILAVGTTVLPRFRAAQPNQALAEDVIRERRYRPDAGLVLCQDQARVQRDILFQARVVAEERCDLWVPASSSRPYLFLLTAQEAASLSRAPGAREVSSYAQVPATALSLRGLLSRPQPHRVVLLANYETKEPVAERRRRRERKRALEQEFGR